MRRGGRSGLVRFLAQIIHTAIGAYSLGLIVYVVLSWTNNPQGNVFRVWLGRFYVPILELISKKIKPVSFKPGTAIDLSPMILLFALYLLRGLAVSLLVPRF